MSAVKKGEKEEIKLQSSLINAHWYSKKGGTCQCTCQLATKLSNKFNFFPGHRDGFWENVVVNLAMAKKRFERLLIHKFVNDSCASKRQSPLPTTVLLRTTLTRTIKIHYYLFVCVSRYVKGSPVVKEFCFQISSNRLKDISWMEIPSPV